MHRAAVVGISMHSVHSVQRDERRRVTHKESGTLRVMATPVRDHVLVLAVVPPSSRDFGTTSRAAPPTQVSAYARSVVRTPLAAVAIASIMPTAALGSF